MEDLTEEELIEIIEDLPRFALQQEKILRDQIELGDRVFGKVIDDICKEDEAA